MSAYIVDDITINRIVAGLRFAADNPDDYNSPIPALTPELYGDGGAVFGGVRSGIAPIERACGKRPVCLL